MLAGFKANVDPARRKPVPSAPRSAERSAPNTERANAIGEMPTPAAYRDRVDLGDAFARGAIFGAHRLAYAMPTQAGCSAQECGAPVDMALAIHREVADALTFPVADICVDVGLLPEDRDDAGPHAPTAFQGFDARLGAVATAP